MAKKTWVGVGTDQDWSDSGNWEPSAPGNGDDVYIENNSATITAGLSQSAVTLTSLNIAASFTGEIGSEFDYLAIGATTTNIGKQSGTGTSTGSPRLKIDYGSAQNTTNVFSTSSSSTDLALEPVRILGSHASNALNVISGIVGVATTSSLETATVATVNAGTSDGGLGATVNLGIGCTLTTISIGNGKVTNQGAAVTTVNTNGENAVYVANSGAHTTINNNEGKVIYNSTGTVTTANIKNQLDMTGDTRAKTITTLKVWKGAAVDLDNGVNNSITLTNGVAIQGARLSEVDLDLGPVFSATIAST